ncbi:chromate transporter [Paenibacillus soyae]|uniref:Chromate transporter n=1 Tax=Paenibacillus soyae TaxID=2969249 RepID=A0A9X2S9F6_9BACL|nr:chromate transporter [Paenibacillus soyae]MCR2802702.1 chromate transporter [Paenibacillus soyae]
MKTEKGVLWTIFLTFLKIGPVTFGGGYAMIPVIEREVVEKRKWLETRDIADIFAVAESIPGAIGINSATFIGYRVAGIRGALAAMIGILLPTFCIILLLSLFFLQMKGHPKMEAAFISIRATIVALIAYAAIKIGKTALVDKTSAVLILLTVIVMYFGHSFIHPVLLIAGGAAAGIGIIMLKQKLGRKTPLTKRTKRTKRTKQEPIFDYMI